MKRIDVADAVQRYLAGETTKQIAESLGVSSNVVARRLKTAGVLMSQAESIRRHFGTPSFSEEDVARRYVAGESEKAIAVSIGCNRDVIRRVLREHGVEIRGRSAAMYVRMANATPEERKALADAAHAAVRGVPQSEEQRIKTAMTREAKQLQTSPIELEFAERLASTGIEVIQQKAIGRYNVDLAFAESAVAVEIFGGNWHATGHHARVYRKRTDYLLDRGWLPVVVWVTSRFPLTDAAVEYVIARHQERRLNKPPVREEHVIRGDGEGGPVSERYPPGVPIVERPETRDDARRHDLRAG